MRRLERGRDGTWWVRETPECGSYSTVSEASTRRRVPVEPGCGRERAEFVARSMGLMDGGNDGEGI